MVKVSFCDKRTSLTAAAKKYYRTGPQDFLPVSKAKKVLI
jgi:hypothetical protein